MRVGDFSRICIFETCVITIIIWGIVSVWNVSVLPLMLFEQFSKDRLVKIFRKETHGSPLALKKDQ